ncbi:MAG: hypothetical protein ACI8YQ_001099 [Polaribacter sp.]|jgi:hypothetical protein
MKLIINLVLVALVGLFIYILIGSIREPIAFQAEKSKREQSVISKLKQLREAQDIYRNVTGAFANDYTMLKDTLKYGKIMNIAVEGDPDDPNNNTITYDTTYEAAMVSVLKENINIDSLGFVPYSNGIKFEMFADTIVYQKTLVWVVEAKTRYADFMGEFVDVKYKKYDDSYNPDQPGERKYYLKFGDRSAPNTSGNWE